jgi:hypothetical protein
MSNWFDIADSDKNVDQPSATKKWLTIFNDNTDDKDVVNHETLQFDLNAEWLYVLPHEDN